MCEAPTVDSGTPPDVLFFGVSPGLPDAVPAEASADRSAWLAPRQPARTAADNSESSRRAEIRLISRPRTVMLARPNRGVRSLARTIVGEYALQDASRGVALLLRCRSTCRGVLTRRRKGESEL